jgi:hypothetical protein
MALCLWRTVAGTFSKAIAIATSSAAYVNNVNTGVNYVQVAHFLFWTTVILEPP